MITTTVVQPIFSHLASLTTSRGLYEHASFNEPRPQHGYCTDDASRALVVLCRQPQLDFETQSLLHIYSNFILEAISDDGKCHNRMSSEGFWIDEPNTGDCWGRALWALGFSAAHAPDDEMRSRSLEGFRSLSRSMTSDRMALAFAALGAGELLIANPSERAAENILAATQVRLQPSHMRSEWLWPEPHLRYSNGSIAEAVMLSGWTLRDAAMLKRGLAMLDFLLEMETHMGHLSVTPIGGRGPSDAKPGFDQQPIEVAAIADACVRAWEFTGNPRWLREIQRAWDWFLGDNDVGVEMFDSNTGAGYDGLTPQGPNLNQGAESTIAMLSTAQQAFLLRELF